MKKKSECGTTRLADSTTTNKQNPNNFRMDATYLLNEDLVSESVDMWIVLAGMDLNALGLFRGEMDPAVAFVERTVAKNLRYRIDFKDDGDDDISDLPYGYITGLVWNCPTRPMSEQEIHDSGTQFMEAWLQNPPQTSDFEAAEKDGVVFFSAKYDHVSVLRASRYIGYLYRSARLNDKSREVAMINELYRKLSKITESYVSKPFKLNLNLDDETERDQFIKRIGRISSPDRVAKALGLKGPDSVRLVIALGRYAYGKREAVALRLAGNTTGALECEHRCDDVYKTVIQPLCECW